MSGWNAFEVDKPFVVEHFKNGFFDYIEVANNVAETQFFKWLIGKGHLERLGSTYPTPRKKEEVPLWVYLSAELTLRLHGASGFAALPYVLHCGGLRDALGPSQVTMVKAGDGHAYRLECKGYNKKNVYPRSTPCDQDFVRKLARSTPAAALEKWLGNALADLYRSIGTYDNEGIFLVDGSYLFVPDNDNYQNSSVLRFNEGNHPVSEKEYADLTPYQKRKCCFRRCYRTVTLLHTNRERSYYLYCGMRVFKGSESEVPHLRPLVEDLASGRGKGKVKWLIFDRGFIDGPTISFLKKAYKIDSVFPLKRNMTIYDDAKRLAAIAPTPPLTWSPPEDEEPSLEGKPEVIRKRERARRETLRRRSKNERNSPHQSGKPSVKEVRLQLIPEMRIWDSCEVPIDVVLLQEELTDGTTSEWLLATTARVTSPLDVWELYRIRPTIEERHRQLKCFWDLTNFRSPSFELVVNQVAFVLLAYSLMQVFLLKSQREEFNRATRKRLLEQLLPMGEKVFLYYQNRAANLDILEYQEMLLTLAEGARRRILGKTKRLRKNLLR